MTARLLRPAPFSAIVLVSFACLAGPGGAQAEERALVRMLGVGAFANSGVTRLFGGGVGINVGDIVQVTFEATREFGRADPDRPSLGVAGSSPVTTDVVLLFIDSVRIDRRVAGGARFQLPTRHRIKPYADISAGVTRVTVRYEPNELGIEGTTDTRPLIEFGGGISIVITDRVAVEIEYRNGRAVREFHDDVFNAMGAAVAFGL